jgi:hypothetical protein
MSQGAAIRASLTGPVPAAAKTLAQMVQARHPGCSVLLYGSGISTLASAAPADVLYDFYAIVPSYRAAFGPGLMAAANRLIPPNVFYIETPSPDGLMRAKYAVLSMAHFKALASGKTFHSYIWARFAQPSRIISAPPGEEAQLAHIIAGAIDTFIRRAAPLAGSADVHAVWQAGLKASYRAELRAESQDRVDRLLESYGQWPHDVTQLDKIQQSQGKTSARAARFGWGVRRYQGALLSVARLVKGIFTFDGGVDYIAWKISRHAGFSLPVKAWERRWPLLGIPTLARRYYKLKAQHAAQNR